MARKKQLVETDVAEEHSKDKFAVIYFLQNILKTFAVSLFSKIFSPSFFLFTWASRDKDYLHTLLRTFHHISRGLNISSGIFVSFGEDLSGRGIETNLTSSKGPLVSFQFHPSLNPCNYPFHVAFRIHKSLTRIFLLQEIKSFFVMFFPFLSIPCIRFQPSLTLTFKWSKSCNIYFFYNKFDFFCSQHEKRRKIMFRNGQSRVTRFFFCCSSKILCFINKIKLSSLMFFKVLKNIASQLKGFVFIWKRQLCRIFFWSAHQSPIWLEASQQQKKKRKLWLMHHISYLLLHDWAVQSTNVAE